MTKDDHEFGGSGGKRLGELLYSRCNNPTTREGTNAMCGLVYDAS